MDVCANKSAGWFTDTKYFLPNWAWIAIAVVIVVVVIIGIIMAVRGSAKNKSSAAEEESVEAPGGEPAPVLVEDDEPVSEESDSEAAPSDNGGTASPAEENERSVKVDAEKKTDKVYHISKRKDDGKWQVKAAKGARAIKLFATQREAIEYAKTLAENQEARIVIHKEDGSFRNLTYKKKS